MKIIEIILVAIGFIVLFALCINALVPALVWLSVPAGVIATTVVFNSGRK
jgi:hypothetical protein